MLYLSLEAAPGLAPHVVLEGCARRGLAGVDLRAHRSGGEAAASLDQWATEAAARGLGVATVRVTHLSRAADAALLATAARHGVPISVPLEDADTDEVPAVAAACAAAGATLLLGHGTDAAAASRLRTVAEAAGAAVGLEWSVRPEISRPGAVAALLPVAAPRLRVVRLFGGGPEAHAQTGQGVGALMARLTLARFAGGIVLTPSRAEYRTAWRHWLQAGGGWGCGSRTADPSLVTLDAAG